MIVATIILTILGYWIAMGLSVAAMMFLFYKFAVLIGDMAEWSKAASC